MNKLRKTSICLLSVSAFVGLIRGMRLAYFPEDESLLFPYPEEMIQASIFSNYFILGWIVFILLGLFSVIALAGTLAGKRNFAYLIIVEGIFASFFVLTHMLYAGFSFIHLVVLPVGIAMIVLGVLQTPRDF